MNIAKEPIMMLFKYFFVLVIISKYFIIRWYPEPDLNRHAIASEGF